MNAKIALLFLVHRQVDLDRIIFLYKSSLFDLFIHVDIKCAVDISHALKSPHVKYVSRDFEIYWAGYNMVKATLNLLQHAMKNIANYEFFVLLSGDALPVMHLDQLSKIISDQAVNRIELRTISNDPDLRNTPASYAVSKHGDRHEWRFHNFSFADSRLTCFRQDDNWCDYYNVSPHEFYRMREGASIMARSVFSSLPIREPIFNTLFFGSQWWILTRQSLELIRRELYSESLERYFCFFEAPDEHFFQCLIGNLIDVNSQYCSTINQAICSSTEGDQILNQARLKSAYAKDGTLFARRYAAGADIEIDNLLSFDKYFDCFS